MTDLNLNLKAKIGCEYRLRTERNGVVTQETPPCFNLITDYGMNAVSRTSGWPLYAQVGSGSATPAFTDIALQSRIATAENSVAFTPSIDTVGRWLLLEKTFTFPAGTATGNISEVGIGAASTTNLISRALIVDGLGNPTSISVLADEDLVLTYKLWVKQPTADFTGTVDGKTFVVRAAVANRTTSGSGRFRGFWGENAWSKGLFEWSARNDRAAVYDGAIGSITAEPSGASLSVPASLISSLGYVADSYTNEISIALGSNEANFATGISAVAWAMGVCCWQMSIDPPLAKASPQTARINVTTTWARE